jgi:hypothetical protein
MMRENGDLMAQSAALPANLDLYLHVRVLIALILGLSVTRLVSGIAALVQHPGRYSIWPVHLCWVAWALLLSAVAARTRNPRFHMLFALSAVAYEISFSIRHFGTLD